ncbi:MAG: HEAT repeat domain-containing protein [bacterium]
MLKKILIIGGICLVMLVIAWVLMIGYFTVVVKTKDEKTIRLVDQNKIMKITAIPIKITNAIIPPPKLESKKPEERKRIIINYLKEAIEANDKWLLLKGVEIDKRVLRMGDVIVPVLIEIVRDTKQEGRVRQYAASMLEEMFRCKNKTLEELIGDEEWKKDVFTESFNLIKKIDIESAVPTLLEAIEDENAFTKECIIGIFEEMKDKRTVEPLLKILDEQRVYQWETNLGKRTKEALYKILKETHDRRIAEALDRNGSDYGVWLWVDEAGRQKVINRAMDILRGNYTPEVKLTYEDEENIKAWVKRERRRSAEEFRELELERKRVAIKEKAIGLLGVAKAKEAVPMLIEMLEKEVEKRDFFGIMGNIITALGKIGTDEAVNVLIELCRAKQIGGGVTIEALGESKNRKAIPFLEEVLNGNDKFNGELAAKALKKITGKEYK